MDLRGLDRRTVTTLVVVAVCVLAGVVLVGAKLREAKMMRAQVATESGRPAVAGDAEPIGDDERTLWSRLGQRLRERYPAEPELPRAMAALAEWSRASGVELVTLDVQPPAASADPTSPTAAAVGSDVALPAELAVNGPRVRLVVRHRYRDLVKFVDGLGRLPVYLALQSLETRRTDDALTTDMSFLTLRWGS